MIRSNRIKAKVTVESRRQIRKEAGVIRDTLIIVGPGGVGKSPLDGIIKQQAVRIDPYRLRKSGPRNSDDVFYAHPRLRDELYLTFHRVGFGPTCLSPTVHWFPQAMTLFLKVRTEWQVLFLEPLVGDIAKAEIFAPAIPTLLSTPQIRHVFGTVSAVVLNPINQLHTLKNLDDLREVTKQNCLARGDKPDAAESRAGSVDEEAPAWLEMIALGAIEYPNWPFPEHLYTSTNLKDKLIEARRLLMKGNPRLEVFFKSEDELRKNQ